MQVLYIDTPSEIGKCSILHTSEVRSRNLGLAPIPGHVKWPRTQVHYVQVSVGGGYSLISYAFQIDVEAGTSNSAALFSGV